jgi:Peptidase family M28
VGLLRREELFERVRRLAAIERPSASPGERQAAELIAADLRDAGAAARLEAEHVHGTYWWPIGLATGAATIAGLGRSRLIAGSVALAAAASVADDVRMGPRLLRRLLPKRPTTNVVAELGPADAPRTVVLVSHHDAAHTGLVFHPELPRAPARRFPGLLDRTNTTPPTMWSAFGGPLLAGLGALAGRRRLRRIGALLSAGNAAAMVDIGLRPVVPGANDNLTGVVTLISVARALAQAPLEGVRVLLVSTGSEESFSEGMAAFGRRHFPDLPPESTHVICLDTVGSPRLLMLEGEGMLGVREYPKQFLALVRNTAERLGIQMVPDLRFRNATDGLVALMAGYPTVMLGSVDEYKFPTNYHWPTDTAENVDYGTVADAARLCEAVIRRLAGESLDGEVAEAGEPAERRATTA